jgi:teichuronic acid biosynthesis glycosyltransferase TuaC
MYPTEGKRAAGTFVKEEYTYLSNILAIDLMIIHPGKSRLAYLKHFVEMALKIQSMNYKILHLQHSHLMIYGILYKLFYPNGAIVLTNHEGEIFKTNKSIYEIFKILLLKKFANRFASEVIYTNKLMTSYYKKDLIHCSVIPVGIDTRKFIQRDKNDDKRHFGYSTDDIIFFIPNHTRNHDKGEALLERLTQYTLDHLTVDHSIHFIQAQNIPHDQMPIYYGMADVVLLLSPYESSPTTIKEALAMNKPILSTNVGDVKSVLYGVSGVGMFNFDEPVETIFKKLVTVLQHDRSNGRQVLIEKGLTLDQTCGKIIDIYDKFL